MKDLLEFLGGLLLGAFVALVGAHIYYSRKMNKQHSDFQKKSKEAQDQLDRMRTLLKEKDRVIEKLLKNEKLDKERLKDEVAKREIILGIIEGLERRVNLNEGSFSAFGKTAEAIAKCTHDACSEEHPFVREDELVQLYGQVSTTCDKVLASTTSITAGSSVAELQSSLDTLSAPDEMLEHVTFAQELLASAEEQVAKEHEVEK